MNKSCRLSSWPGSALTIVMPGFLNNGGSWGVTLRQRKTVDFQLLSKVSSKEMVFRNPRVATDLQSIGRCDSDLGGGKSFSSLIWTSSRS